MVAPDAARRWLATCPRGLPPLLAKELEALGATELRELPAAVSFDGPRALLYRACLWSRLANRILLPIGEGPARDADELYASLVALDWRDLFAPDASIAVEFNGTNAALRNTRFSAQRCKDAIVDALNEAALPAPRVSPQNPDIRVIVRLHRDRVDVALDMVGESLHRRGYRRSAGEAPIKENLAAALLYRGDWPALAKQDAALIDPMCGSATLLIEGFLMAADQAPALGRGHFSFMHWAGHDSAQWQAVLADAQGRARRGREACSLEIRGYDADPRVVRRAQDNIAEADLGRWVRVGVKALGEVTRPTHRPLPRGLVISNPPYGERLGSKESLPFLYRRLGELLHSQFSGWQAAILAGDLSQGRALGLRSHRQYSLFNGKIPVTLLLLDLHNNSLADDERLATAAPAPAAAADAPASPWDKARSRAQREAIPDPEPAGQGGERAAGGGDDPDGREDPGAQMFANRLRKNQKRLKSWLKRSAVECYRLYDADMPEYAVAVDRYGDWLHVAEYKAPASVDEASAAARMAAIRAVLPAATGVPPERIVFKERQRQRGTQQYQRQRTSDAQLSVREGDARLLVNLHDYLDTGLFLDHRPLRLRLAAEARGQRFLNLFCYTGAATIHAAMGGARRTVSVDLSNTYLRWLSQNLAHNGLSEAHNVLVRADVAGWLADNKESFDLILLDPPSFSNSSKVEGSFDVQRDHGALVDASMRSLARGGTLYFSNNRRKFRLAPELSDRYHCEDITSASLDPDYARPSPPHQCWRIQHRQ